MSFPYQSAPTFVLRRISEILQAKVNELLSSVKFSQLEDLLQQFNEKNHNSTLLAKNQQMLTLSNICTLSLQQFVETIKNDVIRVVSSQLPAVVNYQTHVSQKIQDLQQQIDLIKRQLKTQKQNHQTSILQKDRLKLEILEAQNENSHLTQKNRQLQQQNLQFFEENQDYKAKYDEAMGLVRKYMKQIKQKQQELVEQQRKGDQNRKNTQRQNWLYGEQKDALPPLAGGNNKVKQNLENSKDNQHQQNLQHAELSYRIDSMPSAAYVHPQKHPNFFRKDNVLESNLPLQMKFPQDIKEKLNEAQKVLSRSPRQNDPQLQSSHFHLSSQIIGCQKQLLQIELRQSEQQIAGLCGQLEEERSYTKNLEKENDNLQKLLDGEKRLNQKLDRELYSLINTSKQMRIQLLEYKAKNKHLQAEMLELEQSISNHHQQSTELQVKITQLSIQSKKAQRLEDQLREVKSRLQISQKKYEQLRRIKQQLEQSVEEFQNKLLELEKKQTEQSIKSEQFHSLLKNQNSHKIRQIEDMSQMIKLKYQQKMQIIQKHYKQLRDKYKSLKQENSRLYEGMDLVTAKQVKIQQRLTKIASANKQLEDRLVQILKDKQLLQQKSRTLSLINKEIKGQSIISAKEKQLSQRKLRKLQISVMPRIIADSKVLKDQIVNIKKTLLNYNELIQKLAQKYASEFGTNIAFAFSKQKQKLEVIRLDFNSNLIESQSLKKQHQLIQNEKIKLANSLQLLQTQIQESQMKIKNHNQQNNIKNAQISSLKQTNQKLLYQLQTNQQKQRNRLNELQILKAKQNEVQKFYDLVEELTQENLSLKARLNRIQRKQQQQASFKIVSKHQLQTSPLVPPYKKSKHQHQSIQWKEAGKSYQNAQEDFKNQQMRSSKLLLNNSISHSHSCVHFRPLAGSKNKISPYLGIDKLGAVRSPSLERSNKFLVADKPQRQAKGSYKLEIHSRPVILNSIQSSSRPLVEQFSAQNGEDNAYRQQEMQYDFQSQKQRLQQIKQEYQQMLADKFREQVVQRKAISKYVS